MTTPIDAYFSLSKPRIVTMVLVTTAWGFYLGAGGFSPLGPLLWTLFGTALSCAGAGILNNYLERDSDARMKRTSRRPLVLGTIEPLQALMVGLAFVLGGTVMLVAFVNLLTGFLALLTAFLYTLVYTPLKKVTWLNTTIGAIPGALPPLGGWTAATGSISLGGFVLFLILFLWQHPHFYAIAWMYKEDYARGGFKMLPVVEPSGRSTVRQALVFSAALIPVSLFPTFLGIAGDVYLWSALILGVALLCCSMLFAYSRDVVDARRLLRASVVYLPLLLMIIVIDSQFIQ